MTTAEQAAVADIILTRTPPTNLLTLCWQALDELWQDAELRVRDLGSGGRFRNAGFAQNHGRRLWLDQAGEYLLDIQEGRTGVNSYLLRVTFYDKAALRFFQADFFATGLPVLSQKDTARLYASQALMAKAVECIGRELGTA